MIQNIEVLDRHDVEQFDEVNSPVWNDLYEAMEQCDESKVLKVTLSSPKEAQTAKFMAQLEADSADHLQRYDFTIYTEGNTLFVLRDLSAKADEQAYMSDRMEELYEQLLTLQSEVEELERKAVSSGSV